MTEIRASEITKGMLVREYGALDESGFRVAKVKYHGDTVLVTDEDGFKSSFDRDTVVELLPTRLVCPACGSGDELVSWELEPAGYYGTRFFQDPDNPSEPVLDYDHADTKYGEDGSGFIDDVQCNNHTLLELTFADLVPEGTPPNPEWTWPADRRPRIAPGELVTPWRAHVLVKACEAIRDNESLGRYRQEEIDEAIALIPHLWAIAGDVTEPEEAT